MRNPVYQQKTYSIKLLLIVFNENCTSKSKARICTDLYYDDDTKEVTIPESFMILGEAGNVKCSKHISVSRHSRSYADVVLNGKRKSGKPKQLTALVKKSVLEFIVSVLLPKPEFRELYLEYEKAKNTEQFSLGI